MELFTSVEDIKQTLIENSQFIKSLESCCDDSFRDEINKILDEKMKDRLTIGEKAIAVKVRHKQIDTALQKAANEAYTVEELSAKCTELIQQEENKRINVKQMAEFKELKKNLSNTVGGSNSTVQDDDDIVEVGDPGSKAIYMHDPWSKVLMLNAVRNTKCGHHYEHDSVYGLIKDNLGIRCPVVGCASKVFIQPNHLVPDLELREKVKAYKAQQDMDDSWQKTKTIEG